MQLSDLSASLQSFGLRTLGALNLVADEKNRYGVTSIVLIGPAEPLFWEKFVTSREYATDNKDPLDRWSKRVIGLISKEFKAKAFYPFEGPPYMPFFNWAIKAGECFKSPVNLLVHHETGLFVSFRGALGFRTKIEFNKFRTKNSPCLNCEKPCLTACPVYALTDLGYDESGCRSFIGRLDTNECFAGCLVRRSCPVGQNLRHIEQSKFHMKKFAKIEQFSGEKGTKT